MEQARGEVDPLERDVRVRDQHLALGQPRVEGGEVESD